MLAAYLQADVMPKWFISVCVLFLQHTKYKCDANWLKAIKIEFVEAAESASTAG